MNIDFIQKWQDAPCNNGNPSSYLLCPVKPDDYLHVLYPPLEQVYLKKLLQKLKKTKIPPSDKISSYEEFLGRTNGAELYGGSVVLFGYADNGVSGNDEGFPASLLDENTMDPTSSSVHQVLYIGNAVFSANKNIHFYLNLSSGIIAGAVDGQIVIQWTDFEAFLNYIRLTYDQNYSPETGLHLFYDQREKGVIHNIQFFTPNH